MFILNLLPLLESQGISNPQQYLVTSGIPYYTVSRLVNNKTTTINYATLEKLCLLCKCTPDDLFVWVPGEAIKEMENHPLQKLKPKPKVPNPVERIKKLSLQKLQQLQQYIDKLEAD